MSLEKKIHSKQKVNEVLVLYRETCEEVILLAFAVYTEKLPSLL